MFVTDSKARARLDELEERCAKLQREFHQLEIEWADTLDKVKRMMQRVAKRAEVVERAEREESDGEVPTVESGPVLSGRLAQINRQILARRNRGGM